MSKKTQLALRAVKLHKQCGRDAAARFAANNGVTDLYRMARQLSAAQNA